MRHAASGSDVSDEFAIDCQRRRPNASNHRVGAHSAAIVVHRRKVHRKQNYGTDPISPNPNRIHHIADVTRASGRQGRRPVGLFPEPPGRLHPPPPPRPPTEPGTQVTGLPSYRCPPKPNPAATEGPLPQAAPSRSTPVLSSNTPSQVAQALSLPRPQPIPSSQTNPISSTPHKINKLDQPASAPWPPKASPPIQFAFICVHLWFPTRHAAPAKRS
jgi:hypothetical protein